MSSIVPTPGPATNEEQVANPGNPGNGDSIIEEEEEKRPKKTIVNKVVGIGRIELVSPSTDLGIAEALSNCGVAQRVKYRRDVGWLAWDERTSRWSDDGVGLSTWLRKWIKVLRDACRCGGVTRGMRGGGFCPCDQARPLEGTRTRAAILDMAKNVPAFRHDSWDPDPYLFPAANGLVDIRDLSFRPATPEDYITLSSPTAYDPAAKAPRWERFAAEIQEDPEARSFLQKALGSGLTRITRDQQFYFLLGEGANGKGVLQRACQNVLGDLAGVAPSGLFVRQSDQSANRFSLSRLADRRLIFASEVPVGRTLDEYFVKQLTGEDSLVVEEKYKPQQQVQFVGTVIMSVNELPKLTDSSHALRRRLRVIPFRHTFDVNREPDLEETLAAEASGILNWLLRGAHEWFKERGPGYPASIRDATESAMRQSFQLYDFLSEVLVEERGATVRANILRATFTGYARARGLRDTIGTREFGAAIAAFMGASLDKADNHGTIYRGWKLREDLVD